MSRSRALIADRMGAAAVEMALVTPLLLIIACGSIEVGNYFFNEHKLVKAVREGARYAARQSFSNYNGCTTSAADVPTPGTANTVNENTKLLVRTGTLSTTAPDLLANWGLVGGTCPGGTAGCFQVTMTCVASIGTETPSGIYSNSSVGANKAPAVIVTARLPYQPILQSFGFRGTNYHLNATQQASVMGL